MKVSATNKKVIAKMRLTNIYEMNSKYAYPQKKHNNRYRTRAQGLKGAHLGTESKYLIRFLKL